MAKKKEVVAENAAAQTPEATAPATEVEEVVTATEPVGSVVPKEGSEKRKAEQPAKNREQKEAPRSERQFLPQNDILTVAKYLGAKTRRTTVTGVITGVELRDDHAFWTIADGPVYVLIPFEHALPYVKDPALLKDPFRQRQFLAKSMGTEITFSVVEMVEDGDNYLVYGSRRAAMETERRSYFGKNARRPVNVGDVFYATFVSVGPNAGWATAYGVDIRLLKTQVSHRYTENMARVFKPGDEIKLRVQRIDMEGDLPVIVASALPCELEACKPNLRFIRKGSRHIAYLTSHKLTKRVNPFTKQKEAYYTAAMWIDGVNVPGFATLATAHAPENCHPGARVSVEVEEIASNGYVRCRIVAYLP